MEILSQVSDQMDVWLGSDVHVHVCVQYEYVCTRTKKNNFPTNSVGTSIILGEPN